MINRTTRKKRMEKKYRTRTKTKQTENQINKTKRATRARKFHIVRFQKKGTCFVCATISRFLGVYCVSFWLLLLLAFGKWLKTRKPTKLQPTVLINIRAGAKCIQYVLSRSRCVCVCERVYCIFYSCIFRLWKNLLMFLCSSFFYSLLSPHLPQRARVYVCVCIFVCRFFFNSFSSKHFSVHRCCFIPLPKYMK